MGRAKDTFLTGSTAYAVRIVFEWMLGIRPCIDGLVVDPCLHPEWSGARANIRHRGRLISISIKNRSGEGVGVKAVSVDGSPVTRDGTDPASGRRLFVVDDDLLSSACEVVVEV